MGARVLVTDLPPVLKAKFFQGSGAEAGRCILETMVVGPDELDRIPRIVDMTMYSRNFTGNWGSMRIVKARVRNGRMRVVLEDSRWVLKDKTMSTNYNERDAEGAVKTGSQRTIAQLIAAIQTVSGLTFTTKSLPSFYPPAKWAGKSAYVCLKSLLKWTGCRCVYDPKNSRYVISAANSGSNDIDGISKRIFRPGPTNTVKQLKVWTAPVLYESRVTCTAVQINNTTGATEALAADSLSLDPAEEHAQTRFRLWEPSGLSDSLLTGRRAKSHLYDPENPIFEESRIIPDEWDIYPVHQPFVTSRESVAELIETTSGGKVFRTEHPILMREAGSTTYSKTAKVLTAYYNNAGGTLERNSSTITVDGSAADTIEIFADWIKPIDSSEPDIGADSWSSVLTSCATAMAEAYKGDSQNARVANPFDLNGNGNVGGVEYEFDLTQNMAKLYFSIALNFVPGAVGAIR